MPDVNLVRLTPWTDLSFTSAPRQPGRTVFDFEGRFCCTDSAAGCTVTHSYTVQFRRPFRWVYDPLLRSWLQDEVALELERLGSSVDGPTPSM